MPRVTTTLHRLIFASVLAPCLLAWAAEEPLSMPMPAPAPITDEDLPQPLDPGFIHSMVEQSPFSRSVNLEASLQLTGVAYIDGRPVATVWNKATNERVVVTEEPNEKGWRLASAVAGTDLTSTEVHLMVGPETVIMHYGGAQLTGEGAGGKPGGKPRSPGKDGGDGEKFRSYTLLGNEGKQKYAALSADVRKRFNDIVRNQLEKNPGMTPQQSSDYAQKVYSKLKAADTGTGTVAKTPKPQKTTKRKQGA